MQVCLPKHNYKLDKNLLTVEPRARIVLMRIRSRIQLKILIRIQIRGGGFSQKCASPRQNPRYAHAS
jgi:hypothetical protein